MADIIWREAEIAPLAIGGAGQIRVGTDPSTPIVAARVLVGQVAPSGPDDPNPLLVRADLNQGILPASFFRGSFWGAPRAGGLFAAFYGQQVAGVWEAGPLLTDIDLTTALAVEFPWDADWLVQRLAEMAAIEPPFQAKQVRVTRAFPRDTHAWPAVNVQIDGMSPVGQFVGNIASSKRVEAQKIWVATKGRPYSLQLSVTGWCATPEERSALGKWLGAALEAVLDSATALGWGDPSFSIRESENFEVLEIPAFMVTANVTATVQSFMQAVTRSSGQANITSPE